MDTEISKIEQKFDDLQKYVPYLIQITENLKRDGNKAQLNQMQLLHKLLTSFNKRISIHVLLKCEEALERCFGQGVKDLSCLDEQQQELSYLPTSPLISLFLEEENKSEDDCANYELKNEKKIKNKLAEARKHIINKNDKNSRDTNMIVGNINPEIHNSSLNSEDQVKVKLSNEEINQSSKIQVNDLINSVSDSFVNAEETDKKKNIGTDVKDSLQNINLTISSKINEMISEDQHIESKIFHNSKNLNINEESMLKVIKSSQEMIEEKLVIENISIDQEIKSNLKIIMDNVNQHPERNKNKVAQNTEFHQIVNESNDKNLNEIDVADTESKTEQLNSYDKTRNDFLIENSENRNSQKNHSETKNDTLTQQSGFCKLENYETGTNATDKSKTDKNIKDEKYIYKNMEILKEFQDEEIIQSNEKSSENIESFINVNNKDLKIKEIKNNDFSKGVKNDEFKKEQSERSVYSSCSTVIQKKYSNEINDSLSNCKTHKQETKIGTDDNNKDPLLLDKDFENLIKNSEALDSVPENTLSKLIVSDISRLVQEKKLKKFERQQIPTTKLNSSDNNIKNNQRCSKEKSSSYSFKDKSKVLYLVKKDPSESVETIELLDSDEDFYDHDKDNDDDVILVSTKGLKKPSHKLIKKIQHSSGTQTLSKLKPTETMPMFAISSVQSFGTPKALSIETDIKNQLLLIEPSVGTNSSICLKKCESFSNEYQATLRVCTPTKQPETSKYTRDFLSAFQNFNKNQTSSLLKADSKKSTKASKNKNKLFSQLPHDDSTTTSTSDSTSNNSSSNNNSLSSLQTNNKCKEDQVNKEWLDNFVTNILSPIQIKSKQVLEILHKSLDPERYHQLKTIINYHNNPEEICTCLVVSEKVLKLLPDGGTVEKVQLIVKSINEVNIEKLNQEIRELFIKNGKITETGNKVCEISGKNYNKVLTRDRRNGQITSKSRRSKYDQDNNKSDDEEYAPKCNVSVNEQVAEERRRSLRHDSKQINWKQYFNNEDDDYGNDSGVAVHQLNKPKMNKKKRSSLIKRLNGESGAEFVFEHERKKIKIEADKTTIQTPFDTDLLTPTWFESEDPERNSSQEDFNYYEKRRKSYASSTTAASTSTYAYDDSSRLKEEEEEEEEQITHEKNESTSIPPAKVLAYMNTDPAYHCRSKFIDSCLICKEKVQHAVTHYVNQHPKYEVIISRLTRRDIDYISQNINYAFITDSKEKSDTNRTCQYTALCVFCKRDMNFALRYWWEHFTMHTGEYGYECTGCKAKRPRKQSTQTHINNQCEKKRKARVHEIYEFDKSITEIHAYVCVLCNYIQLHQQNLLKHLRNQHNMNDHEISDNIIVVSLIQFSKPFGDLNEQQQQQDDYNAAVTTGNQNLLTTDYNLTEYMEYSNDDLSFMICNMLATDVPKLETNNDNGLQMFPRICPEKRSTTAESAYSSKALNTTDFA